MRRRAWSSVGLVWGTAAGAVVTSDSGLVRPGVLGLHLDRLVMDLGGARVGHRLGAMGRGALGVRRLLCFAFRGPLVRQGSGLPLARALLARSGLSSLIWIVHNHQVPRVSANNQPVSPVMASGDRVALLDARLMLTDQLTPDERAELTGVTLPVITADAGMLDLDTLLTEHRAFGVTVIDGLVMSSLRLGDQTGIHLLGPGDLLVPRNELWPSWLAELDFRSTTPVRLGLLGNDLLGAVHRWPRLLYGLYASMGDQLQRLNVQLVICQLPRVEDRVVALLWLLADSWGHVTPGGVRMPLALTHETLGALVGARRPTVTLALRKLTDDGALVAQDPGWLLVAPPPEPAEPRHRVAPAAPHEFAVGPWAASPRRREEEEEEEEEDPSITYAELRATVLRLREQHRSDREHTSEQLTRVRRDRARVIALRNQIAEEALRRRHPPSS
jgi:CRP/FNR family transcriptional regulator, cyclic AMP receptor protein